MSSSSRPVSLASITSDFATAPNTPGASTPLPNPSPLSHVPTPISRPGSSASVHVPDEADVQDVPQPPQPQPPPPPPLESDAPTPLQDTYIPLPADDTLRPPMAPYLAHEISTPRSSAYGPPSTINSQEPLAGREKPAETYPEDTPSSQNQKRAPIHKRPVFWLAVLVALILIILVVILPVYFTVIKKNNNSNNAAAATGSGSSTGAQPTKTGQPAASATAAITGGDGSLITTSDGVNFTYKNQFGGTCEYILFVQIYARGLTFLFATGYDDPNDPFNNNAQANSWTPPLNTSWTWGTDIAYGYLSPFPHPIANVHSHKLFLLTV